LIAALKTRPIDFASNTEGVLPDTGEPFAFSGCPKNSGRPFQPPGARENSSADTNSAFFAFIAWTTPSTRATTGTTR
jgi:hypothetical protein